LGLLVWVGGRMVQVVVWLLALVIGLKSLLSALFFDWAVVAVAD
jgi:hypothetical protein